MKSAVAKACGHMKASFLSWAGDIVWEKANVPCSGKSSFITKTSKKIKEKKWAAKALLCLCYTERTVLLEPVQDYQALTSNRFFPLSPSPYQKMLLCKVSKKKEAREVISFSFLIASGIIGTLLGSLHELPASQKTAPTAPLHSCWRFEKYRFL